MIVILALGLALAQFNVGETGRRIVKYPWHNKLTIPDRAIFMVNIQKVVPITRNNFTSLNVRTLVRDASMP